VATQNSTQVRALALVAAALVLALVAADAPRANATTPSPRIGLVANTNGLFDRSFNELSAAAVTQASVRLAARIDIRPSFSEAEYIPSLQAMAAQGYDLVIAVGSAEEHAVGVVAREYPKIRFAIVGDSYASPGIRGLANVEGIVFKDQESGYLAGYLAGLVELAPGSQAADANTISTISGSLVPAAARYVAGFRAGARAADPEVRLLAGFANASTSPGRCSSIAGSQIRKGSGVVFAVAGACSVGAYDAAHTGNAWAIGYELDESGLTSAMLVSAVDHPERAVYLALTALHNGTFATGRDVEFGIAQDAVGLAGLNEAVPRSIRLRLSYVANRLRAGGISIPTAPAPAQKPRTSSR
jgi:basic membrane protein A and related proteins